ncbi:MAG: FeoA family protein [Cyclobacteriaceae bacterium]|jgi:ferrous iron transport protein A
MSIYLSQLKIHKTAVIDRLDSDKGGQMLTNKLADMGVYPGKKVEVVFKAPSGDPIAVDLEGYTLSLRIFEASMIEVKEV